MAKKIVLLEGQRAGDVWVFIEQERGEVHPVSWELIGIGRAIADKLQVKLVAVVLGYQIDHIPPEALAFGADLVYVMDDPVLKDYRVYPYRKGICELSRKYKPNIFFVGATTLGRSLAGAVATELETGLTADSTQIDVDVETRQLLASRPTFAGNLMATIVCPNPKHTPQMATVRPRVFPIPPRHPKEVTEENVIYHSLSISEEEVPSRVIGFIPSDTVNRFDLSYAEIIVSGGRGLGNKAGFQLLEEFAREIGGVVGASRAVVDAGWISHDHQVGLTGKTVRPKIYFACGISGAIQHLVGMRDSDVVVAINTDPNAPIFQVADYGIVGDLYQVIPALIEEVRRRKNASPL